MFELFLFEFSSVAAFFWIIILLLPWQPWRTREVLEPAPDRTPIDLSDVTVLIPARNEAESIGSVLHGLSVQGNNLHVVLIDDGSDDGTAAVAREAASGIDLNVISGEPLAHGWSGKLWALEQGLKQVTTRWTLLLDADIRLAPMMLSALLRKAAQDDLRLVTIMATLRMQERVEQFLMPAFIYFFKLLYPFRLANSPNRYFYAAAGGCILIETGVLRGVGAFAAIRGAIIDDCSLARIVKRQGHRIWIGQSKAVESLREYPTLKPIWDMVARTAFTQLQYSLGLLTICTLIMTVMFWTPTAALVAGSRTDHELAVVGFIAMCLTYLPTLRYYRQSPAWALTLPAIGTLYLAMTWSSAIRYWLGERSRWKNRVYSSVSD